VKSKPHPGNLNNRRKETLRLQGEGRGNWGGGGSKDARRIRCGTYKKKTTHFWVITSARRGRGGKKIPGRLNEPTKKVCHGEVENPPHTKRCEGLTKKEKDRNVKKEGRKG